MAYDNPKVITYGFGSIDFQTGEATAIKGPTGMSGRILDMQISVTETFACDDTAANVSLGTAGAGTAYGLLTLADALADTDSFNTWTRGTTAVLPADTQLELAFTAGVDAGTEAGMGYVHIAIMWYND